ncbi:MAG TPA: hypothetical protein VFK05_02225 [Polyangiaceae bacterium]|nr:hypothetical protein [Polyangiaceae bacterium]
MTRARSFGLVWPFVVAAALGYLLGAVAVPAFAGQVSGGASTPLARVGFALREAPQAPPEAWAALGEDVQTVRARLPSSEREVFDLIAVLRGLDNGGTTDWGHAEQICRGLSWQRCDRASLERLRELSRP